MLHIAIDAHSIGANLAGNETYITNLIESLAEIDQVNRYTIYLSKRAWLKHYEGRWENVRARLTMPHSPLVRIPVTLVAELRRRPVDLLHVQYTAPPWSPCPVIATIHDLSFEHLPQTFKRRSRMQLRLTVRHTARQAARIIVPSEFTRGDIATTYNIDDEKIGVTPLAATARFAPVTDETELLRVRETYGIKRDYLLSVGSIQPRKNLVRLLRAFARVRDEWRVTHDKQSTVEQENSDRPPPQLVIVGKRAWLYEEVLSVVSELKLTEDVLFTGYVPETDLPALYTGALAFIYPSYFEGFGLPPLEAMQCGAPVLVGNQTSLPEVVGDAGLLFDPYDESELARQLSRLISDRDLRRQLSVRGIAQARKFSWRRTAQQTLEIYQQAISERELAGTRAKLSLRPYGRR